MITPTLRTLVDVVIGAERTCHRLLLRHNAGEYQLVRASMELWGYPAKTLSWGTCVQGYPGPGRRKSSYSFRTRVTATDKYSFIDGRMVVREVSWCLGLPGVEERDGGKAACIKLSWVGKEAV